MIGLLVSSFVLTTVLVEAKPFRNGLGYQSGMGRRNGMGLDNGMEEGIIFENGMPGAGIGFENGMGAAGMGVGNGLGYENEMASMGHGRGTSSQFANGQKFGSKRFNNGALGFENQAVKNVGRKHYHNVGSHHSKVTSINQAEEDESHNIGGDSAFDSAAQAGKRFNNYQNGASQYGNQFNQGAESSFF